MNLEDIKAHIPEPACKEMVLVLEERLVNWMKELTRLELNHESTLVIRGRVMEVKRQIEFYRGRTRAIDPDDVSVEMEGIDRILNQANDPNQPNI